MVDMLSVAHIAPGSEIAVSSTWVSALSYIGDRGQIRIPLTVGDIYGRSGLPIRTNCFWVGRSRPGLFVRSSNGSVTLLGASLDNGHARVALNAPIDLIVAQSVAKELTGLAADGREVILRITPHRGGEHNALNLAVLVDHSTSMAEACSGQPGSITKHEAVYQRSYINSATPGRGGHR